ncbi:hypothetical protein NPIL_92691 [Nephila pilipes]|uniref:Uncharacterized protein n=1 Tax=Nephila pilipes TaxID=299642 RepID=A0A8X6TXA5_NEPPI|nr:hypothetical protein NPIL_92691 [Nephila pilipes]
MAYVLRFCKNLRRGQNDQKEEKLEMLNSNKRKKGFSVRPLEIVSITPPEERERYVAIFEISEADVCGPLFLKKPLDKVVKTYPGKGENIPVVEVKTHFGTFIRPIQKLYPLEVKMFETCDIRRLIPETQKTCSISQSFYGRTLKPP